MVHVEEIRASMARKGMTQKALAELLGISEKTLSLKMKKGSFGLEEARKMIQILELENPVYIFLS